ncbi:asialoglycoprotein receptor 2-like [Kryptolebias marmoratus]|uniref:asialoglycoprotein receptor 2-like n=1 Tax=Kryptolebias marmoratus TaxID=37003 RepID=UPI0018ACC66E|nr:asialoglycoprotein receptor 2-like [Kryptolebias marmoratus]
MEERHYVNSPPGRRRIERVRQNSSSGISKVVQLVGVSFALVCITQIVLNTYFWQQPANPNAPCPSGWTKFISSCYLISSVANAWDYAKENCESHEAHLVILNDEMEWRFVNYLGGELKLWIGLYVSTDCWSSPDVQWVDGTKLNFTLVKHLNQGFWTTPHGWFYIDPSLPCINNWSLATYPQNLHWICEKMYN